MDKNRVRHPCHGVLLGKKTGRELLVHATTWTNELKILMQSKKGQTKSVLTVRFHSYKILENGATLQ